MKKTDYNKVYDFLKSCTESEVRFCEIQLAFARDLRQVQKEHDIPDDEMVRRMKFSDLNELEERRKGGREVSTIHMSLLDTIAIQEERKERREIKINTK